SAPYDGAPDACSLARERPKLTAFSGVGRPGSTQVRIRHSASKARTSGTETVSDSASQLSPAASLSKNPTGGCGRVLTTAVRPSESRSRVAVQTSPPATGLVETTGVPSSRSARWAIVGIVATTVSLSKPPGV